MEQTYSFLIIDTFKDDDKCIHGLGYTEDKIPFSNKEAAEFVIEQYRLCRKEIPFAAAGIVVLIFDDERISHNPCRVFRLRSTLKHYLKE